MKEILAKFGRIIVRFFCLFKLTISCKLGFKEKEEDLSDKEENLCHKQEK